ncbi:DMT family transporter [Micromonospora sp. NBC_00362]|uniref:DMT family transporter n=1 Tax=Micromonospora sp. NBC_00362 TaxID=2975975 RepID=UPI002251FF9F|nr:DMT family transporter [Micromonospora sp. NBC_00362]MCX5122095.1 DMT family transporter [Micromonospora sp. NBC_00362]
MPQLRRRIARRDELQAPGGAASLTSLLYLGMATMALAYGLLYDGLRTTSGSTATAATLLEPVSAALLAVILLNERLAWPALVGGTMILAAVASLRPTSSKSGHRPSRGEAEHRLPHVADAP